MDPVTPVHQLLYLRRLVQMRQSAKIARTVKYIKIHTTSNFLAIFWQISRFLVCFWGISLKLLIVEIRLMVRLKNYVLR